MNKLSLSKNKISLSFAAFSFFSFIFVIELDPNNPHVSQMAAIASLMAILWITEVVPLAVTALIPLILFPFFGISSGKVIAPIYMNHIIFVFIGGFMLALAMEKWNLHRRIALRTILLFGNRPSALILGFMVACAFLSMWISNTATCVMMFPIAIALLKKMEEDQWTDKNFSIALLLCIAYSCSIGGIATIIGTPPNLIFIQILELNFPDAPAISFTNWFLFGLPISVSMLLTAWFIVTKVVYKQQKQFDINKDQIHDEYKRLGKMSYEEKMVSIVFSTTALLWIFRADLNIGSVSISGWAKLFDNPSYITDGTVAVTMAALLFFIPSKKKEERLLDNSVFKDIPWDIIIFFGGGFALAKGMIDSGFSTYMAETLMFLGNVGTFPMLISIAAMVTFMTELTSNMATTQMLLPILASLADVLKINPLFLMITATISASMAFMMPVATGPNAIIFGSKRIKVIEMVKAGLLINLAGIVIISVMVYFFVSAIFGFQIDVFPDWANTTGGQAK